MFTDGMSRLAVAVSVTVALSLAIFLTILVLLLADLICAHLRRRRLRAAETSWSKLGLALATPPSPARVAAASSSSVATTATATATTPREALAGTPPFYYAHGVLHAPSTKDLLVAIPRLEGAVWRWSPPPPSRSGSGSSGATSACGDAFMCISNPVYDRGQTAAAGGGDTPPFETLGSSPSPFGVTKEEACAYDEEEDARFSPPLSAMRKLPPLGVLAAYPPPALRFADGRPSPHATVADTNRASSSSSSAHFFSYWSSK
jgi:hypothetical protein